MSFETSQEIIFLAKQKYYSGEVSWNVAKQLILFGEKLMFI